MMAIKDIEAVVEAVRRDPLFEGFEAVRFDANSVEVHRTAQGTAALLALPPLWRDAERAAHALATCSIRGALLVCLGEDAEVAEVPTIPKQTPTSCVALPTTSVLLHASLTTALDMVASQLRAKERGQLAERYRFELGEIIAIAKAINSERDLNRLLGLILEKSRYVTGADAGSIYVLIVPDPDRPEHRLLKFEVAQNESLSIDFRSFTMEVSQRSIVGAAVLRREVINIPDLYELDEHNPLGVEHDRSFDLRTGYQTRSVLTVPLLSHRDQVIGVLQLINKKLTPGKALTTPQDFEDVVPFDEHSVELCKTLASQAGISLENALLYNELQRVFEGFVEASIQAIESRDPTTSGHSRRVADLTVGLAEAVCREDQGPYGTMVFNTEDLKAIEYAGLLHDFGKIGVPEAVLVKPRKLHDWQRDIILARFDYIRQWMRAESLRKRLELGHSPAQLASLDDALVKQEEYLDLCVSTVVAANQPTVMDADRPALLKEIASQTYVDPRGETLPYLLPAELECLSIARGSLSPEEREQIESHVQHTKNFLCSIPWGPRFRQIPAIAGSHHEKLDGSGYPAHKSSLEIPVPAKMMAIADIFDALTASDRPYKKAVPWRKALQILEFEMKDGKLDSELLRLFVEAKVYLRVLSAED
jgi:HD-GYP domain-containing protein (c-di-GMP phosphodiesterase class II)